MPDGLYERDILAWSEEQARLLGRLAAGEPGVNAVVDWPNVIEELEAVGRGELRACESLLLQAMVHLLKLHAWPGSRSAGHWRAEALSFMSGACRAFSPSMRQRLDMQDLYRDAARDVRNRSDDSGLPRPLPDACPFTPDDLLRRDADVHALAARLGGADA